MLHFFTPQRAVLLSIAICLTLTLSLGVLIRTPHLSSLEGTSVLDPDSARYLRQAQVIVEQGHLPSIDSMRHYPIGKSSATQLSVYPYTLAFLYKCVSLLFRGVTLEQIITFSSLLFFSLSLIVFYFLMRRLLGWPTALLATNLCVVVPSTLGRSVVGYADRDAFCLFLAFGSYYLYISAYQSSQLKNRLILGLLSGVVMMLLGLTWQGAGLFISIIVLLNFICFMFPNYWKTDSYLYLIWLSPVIIGLLGFKSVYRDFSQAHAILAVGPSCGLLVLVLLFAIVSKHPKLSEFFTLGGKIPLSFAVTVVTVGLGSVVLLQFSFGTSELLNRAWTHFLGPFGSGRLETSIEELQKRGVMSWSVWPGYFLIFIVGGTLILMKRFASTAHLNVWVSLTLFEVLLAGTILTRFASMKDTSYESPLMTSLYASSLIAFAIGMTAVYLWSYSRQRETQPELRPDIGDLFLWVSFCVLLFSARGAIRFEFFFAPVAMALGCYAFVRALETLGIPDWGFGWILLFLLVFEFYAIGKHLSWLRLPHSYYDSSTVLSFALITAVGISAAVMRRTFRGFDKVWIFRSGVVAVFVFLLLLLGGPASFPLLGGYADLSYTKAAEIRPIVTSPISRALEWLKRNTPQSSIVAAWWDHGSFINLLSHRTTIIDEQQLPYWVHLMARHVLFAETDLQALEFLKAHGATHLLITRRELRGFGGISILASDEDLDRYSFLTPSPASREIIQSQSGGTIFRYNPEANDDFMNAPITVNGKTYPVGAWKINGIYLKLEELNGDTDQPPGILIEIESEGQKVRFIPEEFYYRGMMYQQSGENILPCTLLISSHTDNPLDWEILCLPPKVRNTLMIRLYLLNQVSDYFRPVYPPETGPHQDDWGMLDYSARIWEIHYPQSFPTDSKYLRTDFPDSELHRLWK